MKWEFILFMCPACGKTAKVMLPTTFLPNTTCMCGFPDSVYEMIQVHPPIIERGKDAIQDNSRV